MHTASIKQADCLTASSHSVGLPPFLSREPLGSKCGLMERPSALVLPLLLPSCVTWRNGASQTVAHVCERQMIRLKCRQLFAGFLKIK